ncbi:MAG: Hsp20/alpha crystallin family protein [Bacteroidaceae bacterium]|nr:Hsp20/alpha crystallin family protein [Bacteroidaceae bacterium]
MLVARRNSNDWLPSLFNDFFYDSFPAFTPAKQFASPAVNVIENEKDFEIEVAAPGMNKEDLNVQVSNEGELLITLEKKSDKEDKKDKKNYLRREFSYSAYRQAFTLPDDIESDKITAQMTNGILHITLPKKEVTVKTPESRRIEIL